MKTTAERTAKVRRKRRARGLCYNCGGPPTPGTFLCARCRETRKENHRRRVASLRDQGRCRGCGRPAEPQTYHKSREGLPSALCRGCRVKYKGRYKTEWSVRKSRRCRGCGGNYHGRECLRCQLTTG